MNRFLDKQANEEEMNERLHGALLPAAGSLGGAITGFELAKRLPNAGILGGLAGSLAGSSVGEFAGSKIRDAMNYQRIAEAREELGKEASEGDRVAQFYRKLMPLPQVMQEQLDKKSFVELREELEKSALFGKKKAPSEMDALIAERNQAIDDYKKNVGRLDDLNPQAKADMNAAMGTAQKKPTGGQKAAQPTSAKPQMRDFGDYFKETPPAATATAPIGSRVANNTKPKMGKGKLGLIAGGAALAAGTAGKMGYDKWKEEKVAFVEMREVLEKNAAALK